MDRDRASFVRIRTVRQGPDEAALDRAYWAALAPEQRIELVWELTVEQWRMRGWDPDEPGLCRSVAVLHRR